MSDVPEAQADGQPTVDQPAVGAGAPVADDRPELAVGAAFAGGLILAMLFKRMAR